MSRTALVVVWFLGCAVTTGAWWLVSTARRSPDRSPASLAAQTPPAVKRVAVPWARWTVTEQLVASSVLVLQVETNYPDEALAIARELVEPQKARFAEVMIYFHRPGRPSTLPPRRVQWSPARGYVETDYEH